MNVWKSVGKTPHHCSLISPFKIIFLRGNIKHSTKYLISWKFVKNTTLHVVFSTFFSLFDLVMKHSVPCMISYMKTRENQNKEEERYLEINN